MVVFWLSVYASSVVMASPMRSEFLKKTADTRLVCNCNCNKLLIITDFWVFVLVIVIIFSK